MVSEDVCQPFATRSHKLGSVKRHPNKKITIFARLKRDTYIFRQTIIIDFERGAEALPIEKHTSKHYESITNF